MGAPYNSFTFDNINSLTEGVYISGSSAFNAPERDVEMIAIPGRNGEFIRDNGRFNNIEVTYPCGVVGDSTDFKTKMQNIRNKLASKRGYCRLVDTYNPNEYRMGVFKDAIEVEPVAQNTAGEFEVMFNCKPQRYLMSGEAAISVADGDEVFNPTPFDAQPMIEVEDYGTLVVNGHEIEIASETMGNISLYNGYGAKTIQFDKNLVKTGDIITIGKVTWDSGIAKSNLPAGVNVSAVTTQTPPVTASEQVFSLGNSSLLWTWFENLQFTAGTSLTVTDSWVLNIALSNSTNDDVTISVSVDYDGVDTFTFSYSLSDDGFEDYLTEDIPVVNGLTANSTVSTLGHPMYIDCDLGEVYKIENGSYIQLNSYVDLGSKLPVLSPGNNLIEYDNTMNNVKIVPRWWIV